MKIKIETKFEVGDEVWFVSTEGDFALNGRIESINYSLTLRGGLLQYCIALSLYQSIYKFEPELHTTKEEALKTLKEG